MSGSPVPGLGTGTGDMVVDPRVWVWGWQVPRGWAAARSRAETSGAVGPWAMGQGGEGRAGAGPSLG